MAEKKLTEEDIIQALQRKAFSPEDAQAWAQCLLANDFYLESQFSREAFWDQLGNPPKTPTPGIKTILGQLFGVRFISFLLSNFFDFFSSVQFS